MLDEHTVGDAKDIGGDPVPRPSVSREPAVDDYVISFGNDHARLVFQPRRCAPDQIEQAVASGSDMRAVLNVVRRPIPIVLSPAVDERRSAAAAEPQNAQLLRRVLGALLGGGLGLIRFPASPIGLLEAIQARDQRWAAMWARCARPPPNEAFSPAIS